MHNLKNILVYYGNILYNVGKGVFMSEVLWVGNQG